MKNKNIFTKNIRKGDNVIVLAGKDKGKTGDVLKVYPGQQKVLVQGVNIVKRHTAPSQNNPGGIDQKESAIHISNVSLLDPDSGKPTKVGFKILEDGRKVRIARASGEMID
ncbi:MAG: 50S ribosomal protein L24 [Rhodospirillaceae bacterium]|jgi:large subunit ribosomal protein L24|nr:50S ribosomal protein L24 [Rhodospirillaceae bacterium]